MAIVINGDGTITGVSAGGLPDASVVTADIADVNVTTAKVADNAITLAKMAGGTDGNIISYDASGDPVAVVTGSSGQVLTSAGAGAPPTFAAAAGGGDSRNFIIDGDFTQWPEGDKTSVANVNYTSALFKYVKSGGEIVVDSKQTADAPTVAQSGHASTYCLHMDVTTAESAVAAGDFAKVHYHVTGSDFAFIHQQEITISFWHKHTKTGIYGCSLTNSAFDRSYVFEYTQTTTNTWEKATKTLTLDSSGTWLLTEAGIGLILAFTMFSGSTYHATADAWGAGDKLTTSNQVAGGDNAANNFKLSQVGLYLGSTAPTFLGESIATVTDQVAYYVEDIIKVDPDVCIANGHFVSTTQLRAAVIMRPKRISPSVTDTGTATDYGLQHGTGAIALNALNGEQRLGRNSFVWMTSISTTKSGGEGGYTYSNNTNAFLLCDSRH